MNLDSPQDAEADFAVAVKVGVEANSVVTGGDELHSRRVDGIVRGAAEQEEEKTALVRRVEGACDQGVDLQGERRRKWEEVVERFGLWI